MKKLIVASDSFKGTLSSAEIGNIAKKIAAEYFPQCEVITIPVADGGEGTAQCFISALGAEKAETSVSNALYEKCTASYAFTGETAIIDMASAAGLPQLGERSNPAITTTFGVGEMMLHAIKKGAKTIVLGLGGSATNDCGCGCAAALGAVFSDENGESFIPTGKTLSRVADIDLTALKKRLAGVRIVVMCDVTNPLFGENGAAYVFAPQKGADGEMVKLLDDGLRSLSRVISDKLGIEANIPGAGAAGGMGAGAYVFLGAELKSGIDVVLDTVDFDRFAAGADLIVTGEGRLDSQSLGGKVISGIARRAEKAGVPVIAIAGATAPDAADAAAYGLEGILVTNRASLSFNELKTRAKSDYENAFRDLMRIIKAAEGFRV